MSATTPRYKRLGKLPPKHDPRDLRLGRYLRIDKLPAPPSKIDHASRVAYWPMFLNDQLGICGPAGAAHQIQSWTTYAERGTLTLSDRQVRDAYFAITGGQDTGVYLSDMANYWRHTGIGGEQVEAYVTVNPNLTELKLTIQIFGSAGVGLSLPDEGTFGPWDRVYGPPNPYNGHYVCLVGYDDATETFEAITWGEKVIMSYAFALKYIDEAYAFLDDISLIAETMVTPEGFDRAQLEYDLLHLGDPIDPPEPPPPPPPPAPEPGGCNPLGNLIFKLMN
jgi:hypothetical protein